MTHIFFEQVFSVTYQELHQQQLQTQGYFIVFIQHKKTDFCLRSVEGMLLTIVKIKCQYLVFVQEGLQKLVEHELFNYKSSTGEDDYMQAQSCQVGDAHKSRLSPQNGKARTDCKYKLYYKQELIRRKYHLLRGVEPGFSYVKYHALSCLCISSFLFLLPFPPCSNLYAFKRSKIQ